LPDKMLYFLQKIKIQYFSKMENDVSFFNFY